MVRLVKEIEGQRRNDTKTPEIERNEGPMAPANRKNRGALAPRLIEVVSRIPNPSAQSL
jgi:hypothetical protein